MKRMVYQDARAQNLRKRVAISHYQVTSSIVDALHLLRSKNVEPTPPRVNGTWYSLFTLLEPLYQRNHLDMSGIRQMVS